MGEWTGLQAEVQRRLDALVAGGREIGLQVAAYLDGRLIVNAAAGLADESTGAPVTPDTPFLNYSAGKGLTSAVVHVLAERGELDYDLRIADVWPEYGRHGKQDTTLADALLHAAGVPCPPSYTMPQDLLDWDKMCRSIAGMRPVWEPGTRHGLHEWTYGWLVGEVVRRVTQRPISWVLAEEIARPLGADRELFFGVPPELVNRVARLKDRSWSATLDRLSARVEHFDRVYPPAVRPDAALANRRDLLRADIPSTAVASARGIARVYAALMGEVDGVRLISPERLATVSAVRTDGPDWTTGAELPKTLGFAARPGCTRLGWSSAGGGLTGFHPDLGLAVAATRNHLSGDHDDPLESIAGLIQAAAAAR
ncbi:serine hydrolase domain-containing protein [Actinoplanes sp. NPDC049548]|uniref:serine hydrolase domain-containing protein n=1 Tax=Actinoplanes sp. NPDC049548 TaxID=3155152 RepID=UPI003431EEE0